MIRLTEWLVPALAIAYMLVVLAVVPHVGPPFTTYGRVSTAATIVDLAAGLGLMMAGLVAWIDRSLRAAAITALMAGACWFGADWTGWEGGPSLIRSLGMVMAPLVFPMAGVLALAGSEGRRRTDASLLMVAGLAVAAAAVSVGQAALRDPILDRFCWSNCADNVFLVTAIPGVARLMDGLWLATLVVGGIGLTGLCLVRLIRSTRAGRQRTLPFLIPGAIVGGAYAAYGVGLLLDRAENPLAPSFLALFVARSVAIVTLALGLAWVVVRASTMRRAVAHLAADLGAAPSLGALQAALSRSLGDDGLEIAYWLPTAGIWADEHGRVVDLELRGRNRAISTITRSGEPVASVIHDPGLLGSIDLQTEIGAAARLAAENERLLAEIRHQLEDLRASRSRIVAAGDAERRRLERNLHDGAQHWLLGLSYELRLADDAAASAGDEGTLALLRTAGRETRQALEQLRELAHGIFPKILGDGGLAPALAALADDAPLPVELQAVTRERFPPSVEAAGYVAVAEAIRRAVELEASYVTVHVEREDDLLKVMVAGEGQPGEWSSVGVADRVGAIAGRVVNVEGDPLGTRLRVEIPCAS